MEKRIILKNFVIQKKLFIFLIIFLPFYSFLRAFLLIRNASPLMLSTLSYTRDILIIIGFVVVLTFRFVSQNRYTIKKSLMTSGVIIYIISSIYGFVISVVYGNFVLAIKALHVTIVPMIIYLTILMSKGFGLGSLTKLYDVIVKIGLVIIFSGFFFYIFRPDFFVEMFNAFRPVYADTLFAINYTRMVGCILSPNVFGSFMAMISIIAFNWPIHKYYMKIIFSFSFIATVLSLSRGSWMFLISGLLISVLFKSNKQQIVSIKYFFAVILLILIYTTIFPHSWKVIEDRVNTIFSTGEGSAYERSSGWKDALDALTRNPFGYGLGVGGQINVDNKKTYEASGIGVIDGFYFKIMAETGLIGIASFIIFLILSVIQLVLSIKKSNDLIKTHHIITLSILIGSCLQSIGSNPFDFILFSPFVWLFLGISNDMFTSSQIQQGKRALVC